MVPSANATPADIQIERYDFTKSNLYYKFALSKIFCFKDESVGKQYRPIDVYSATDGYIWT